MKPLLICLILLCTAQIQAQTIKGKVKDAASGQPLESALVADATNTNNAVMTDEKGNFVLKTKASTTNIIITYIGYENQKITVQSNRELNVALQPGVVKLKDVTISPVSNQRQFSNLAKIDLNLKPVRSTQELMRIVPGLFVAQHAGGGKAEQIFLRGFDIDHGTDIAVSVDGLPVNMVSHAHGQGYADAHFIIPETINTLDFGTGPYYAAYGNLNTAGYINFKTYKSISENRVQVEAGRFNTYRAMAMIDLIKKNKEKQSAYIAGEINYSDGPTLSKQNFHRLNVFGKYNLAVGANTSLTFSASAFESKWDASGQVPDRAVAAGMIDRFGAIDDTEGGNTERYNANLQISHNFKNGAVWNNQFYYSRYLFNLYSNFTFFLNDSINGDGIQQAEARNIFGYTSNLNKRSSLGSPNLTSDYGAGFRHDDVRNSQLSHVVKREFLEHYTLGDIQETNAFAFTRQQIQTGKWLFEGGLRFDHFRFNYDDKLNTSNPAQSKSIISPKVNIQYTFSKATQVYVKGGKGFHSNDARVVTAVQGKEILPAAYGADLGINLKPSANLFINVAAWYLHLQQEFVYVGDEGITEPGGKTERKGIDVLARWQMSKNLFANINLNYTKSKALGIAKGEDNIPLAPKFTSTGGIFYKQKSGLNGGLSYRWIADRPANENNSVTAKGYFLLDGTLNYTTSKYEIGIAAENIFNSNWNEAQFDTESRLKNEPTSVSELHYTPGIPFFARFKLSVFL